MECNAMNYTAPLCFYPKNSPTLVYFPTRRAHSCGRSCTTHYTVYNHGTLYQCPIVWYTTHTVHCAYMHCTCTSSIVQCTLYLYWTSKLWAVILLCSSCTCEQEFCVKQYCSWNPSYVNLCLPVLHRPTYMYMYVGKRGDGV